MKKKKYKMLGSILIIELVILKIMQGLGIKLESGLPAIMGIVAFFIPLQLILYNLSKEETQAEICKMIYKFFFWCFNFACIGAILIAFSR